MTSRNSFRRKIVYLAIIALLLMPLFWLSQPATSPVKGEKGSPGGVLAQLREKHHLSQAQLGQIDPTSVTIKLATLGMRGIAANILWEKANEFKMKKDWTNLGATLNQITKVQPNFINVWSNQGWNLSYNVSVEFDDFRQRYRWVIKGIDFLKEGIKYNERQPRLVNDIGRTISQKIGRADESKQYRILFKKDDDFHGARPLALRDNWLVGKEYYDRAVEMVDRMGVTMMGASPLLYRSSSPMCLMYYAEYLEKDGIFGEVAKSAWADAAAAWRRYGDETIPTSWTDEKTQEPIVIRLNDQEQREESVKKLVARLDAIAPGLRDKLISDKRTALTPAQREAIDIPAEKRTAKQAELAYAAEESIKVAHEELARKITGSKRDEAKRLAKEIEKSEQIATYIHRYRDIVNFVYWRLRADVERLDDMLAARKLINQGDRAYADADLDAAKNAYQNGMKKWRLILDKYPSLVADVSTHEDLSTAIKRYRRTLSQLDEPFPEKFILQDVVDAQEQRSPSPPAEPAEK